MKIKNLLLCLLLVGCSAKDTEPIRIAPDFVSDASNSPILPLYTSVTLTMYNQSILDQYDEQFNELIKRYHKLADANRDYDTNNIKTINDHYGDGSYIKIEPELFHLIDESLQFTKATNGLFNPTIGAVMDLYENKFSNLGLPQADPSIESMQAALACVVSVDKLDTIIEMKKETSQIRINTLDGCSQQVSLQLGAYSKGYISERLFESLKLSDHQFLIDLGSSSQTMWAPEKNQKTWSYGLKEPGTNDILLAISLENQMSISTSADDQQYYRVADNPDLIRSHIIDPFTGYSSNYYRGVSVFASTNGALLDGLSTVLMNIKNPNDRIQLIEDLQKQYQIEIGYGLITATNQIICNQYFKDHISYQSDEISEIITEETK